MLILLAPIYAFFSRLFYRAVGEASPSQGFLYLLYLSGISFVVAVILVFSMVLPAFQVLHQELVIPFKRQMPVITWKSGEGVSIDRPSPCEIKIQRTKIIFDMDKPSVTPEEFRQLGCLILITKTKLYIQKSKVETQVIDLVSKTPNSGSPVMKKLVVSRQWIEETYQKIKKIVCWAFPLCTPFFYFLTKLIQALFFSLFGLLFNLLRQKRLGYGAILNLSIFTLTPWAVIEVLSIPFKFTAPGWIGWVVTLSYLYFGTKLSEERTQTPA